MKWPPMCYSGEHTSPVQCSYPSFCLNSIRGNNRRDPDCGKLHNRHYVDSLKMSMSRKTRKLKETVSLLEKVHDLKERISLCAEKPRGKRSKKRKKEGKKTVFYREPGHTHSHQGFLGTGATAVLYPPYLLKSTQRPPPHRRQGLLPSSFYAMKYEAQLIFCWLTCPAFHSFTPSNPGPKSTALTTVLSLTAYMGGWREGKQELIFIKQLQTCYLVDFSLQPHEVGLISFYWGSSANGLWDKVDSVPSCCSSLKRASVCNGFSVWTAPRICWGPDISSPGAAQGRTGSDVARVTRPGCDSLRIWNQGLSDSSPLPPHCLPGKALLPLSLQGGQTSPAEDQSPALCRESGVRGPSSSTRVSAAEAEASGSNCWPCQRRLSQASQGGGCSVWFQRMGNTHTSSKWPLPPLAHLSPGSSPGFGPVEIYVVAVVF